MKCFLRLLRIAAVAGSGAIASSVYGVPANAQVISNPHVQPIYVTPHSAEERAIFSETVTTRAATLVKRTAQVLG
jgi:hypothetical protein